MLSIKNNLFYSLFIPLILFISVNLSSANTQIVFPADKAIISAKNIIIIGQSDEDSSPIELTIENDQGKTNYKVEVTDLAFSKRLELSPGLNKISLSSSKSIINVFQANSPEKAPKDFRPYFIHNNLKLKGKCQECHLTDPNKPGNYTYLNQTFTCISAKCHQDYGKKKFQHGPFEKRQCADCHNIHGNFNKDYTLAIRAELCFTCHSDAKDMASDGKYVHFPVSKGECTSCHDPHESDLEYHLKRGSILELCAGCHGKKMLKYEYMHEPVAEGDCNACHTPHTSDIKGLLYKKGKDLCLTCHEVRKEEFRSKYVHKPVSQDCSICHDPHGSATEYHLRTRKDKSGHYLKSKQPIKDLCLSCHRKLNPKIAKAIKSSKVTHKPVTEGKCIICHTPHSTNFPKQLRDAPQKLCFSCHKKIAKKINDSLYKHGPVAKGDCAQCHLVHGSKNKKLLRNNFSKEYSGPFSLDNFKLCLNCHNKKVYTQKFSEETGFRNGNQNLHYLHVNHGKKSTYCKSCHDIHASNQEKHIRESMIYKRSFKITIQFNKSDTGGGCVVGCHKPKKYDRNNPLNYR